jgi:hypothetical protein
MSRVQAKSEVWMTLLERVYAEALRDELAGASGLTDALTTSQQPSQSGIRGEKHHGS